MYTVVFILFQNNLCFNVNMRLENFHLLYHPGNYIITFFISKPSFSKCIQVWKWCLCCIYKGTKCVCEKVRMVNRVQSPLAAFYSLLLGWMKNHLLGLNYNLAFSLFLPLKIINGPLLQQLHVHVVQHCFYVRSLMTFLCQLKRNCLNFMTLHFLTAILKLCTC